MEAGEREATCIYEILGNSENNTFVGDEAESLEGSASTEKRNETIELQNASRRKFRCSGRLNNNGGDMIRKLSFTEFEEKAGQSDGRECKARLHISEDKDC